MNILSLSNRVVCTRILHIQHTCRNDGCLEACRRSLSLCWAKVSDESFRLKVYPQKVVDPPAFIVVHSEGCIAAANALAQLRIVSLCTFQVDLIMANADTITLMVFIRRFECIAIPNVNSYTMRFNWITIKAY